ncbi:bifunctional DNA primase/polymerase, partial [Streptomyces hundungensis]|uniref:bifunctional DNA primase/polymerase n=1 Tax=Streptomyces hundungensis TaxID=1077946 RepID=UPI00340BD6C8
MGAEFGRSRGEESKLSRWLRRRPKDAPGADPSRLSLLLAVAAADLPLAPAAYPIGYRCSCERMGCPTPARHPVSFAWQTQSTTDPAQIERWALLGGGPGFGMVRSQTCQNGDAQRPATKAKPILETPPSRTS